MFLMLALGCSQILQAQEFSLKGSITAEGKPLELVTIIVSNDGKIIATAISDTTGTFSCKLAAGAYKLEISRVGYKTFQQQITIPANTLTIAMEPDAKMLKQVSVSGNKPVFERKFDRIIFNVQNSIMASGGTMWEAIGRAPGVRTSMEGGINANGKNAVIYMDDKLLRLSGDDLVSYLTNLSAENIVRIEVITNPSARYDAQGGAVINIITKKRIVSGFNASLNGAFTQATYDSYRSGMSFNYRSGNLSLYGNYSYNNAQKSYDETDYIVFQSPTSYSDWEGIKSGWRKTNAHTYRFGMDYNLSKSHVVGFLVDGSNSARTRTVNARTDIYNNHLPTVDSILLTGSDSRSDVNLVAFNVNYKGVIDTARKRTLNIDIDYTPFRNKRMQDVNTQSYKPDGSKLPYIFDINNDALQDIEIASARLDYSQMISSGWLVETGVKYSSISNDNDFRYFDMKTGTPVLDTGMSNRFLYTENISAMYFNFRGYAGKVALQAGLRAEYTQTSGNSITLEKVTNKDYFKVFPTLYAGFNLKKNHEMSVYYGIRINRPDYWRLNPFKYYSSPYTYLEGNPNLRPAYVHEVEVEYTFKKQYSATLFYRNKQNYFTNITVQDNVAKIYYDTQRNLDNSLESGVYFSIPVTPRPWWEMNYFLQASVKREKSGYQGGTYDYKTGFVYISATEAFILSKKKGWRAEVMAWYASPGIQGIYHLGSSYDLSFGLRKTMFKGKGSLQLQVADIFFSNYYRIKVDYENQYNGFKEMNDTRSVTLNFSYRFDTKKKIDAARRRTVSDEDEKKRARN